MKRVQSAHRAPTAAGYRLDLGDGLAAALHPDGGLTLEGRAGAADLSPGQVEQLAALLALGAGQRAQARRRRARAAYVEAHGAEQGP